MKRLRHVVAPPACVTGSGRVPKSSIVLVLGVAVNATKVMPISCARQPSVPPARHPCSARRHRPSSCNSSGDNTALSLAAASPDCELWASSAITANRLPCVAASSRTLARHKETFESCKRRSSCRPIGLSPVRALAAPFAFDRRHHAGCPLEVENRLL